MPGCVLAACVAYGHRVLNAGDGETSKTTAVAIIQGSLDTEFASSEEDQQRITKQQEESFADYSRMTSQVTSQSSIELVLWPESMFSRYYGILRYDPGVADRVVGADGQTMETMANILEVSTKQHIRLFGVNCLMGSKHHALSQGRCAALQYSRILRCKR